MRYKAIIFDVDGTILDNEKQNIYSLQQLLLSLTNKHYSYEELYFCLGIPGDVTLARLGIPNPKETQMVWYELSEKYAHLVKPFSGIIETFQALKKMDVRLGIVTSRPRDKYLEFLEEYHFSEFIEKAVCSGETMRPKPSPDPLIALLKEMHLEPSEALYVGDSSYDMECAAGAGVDGALALWGACQPEQITSTWRLEKPQSLLAL